MIHRLRCDNVDEYISNGMKYWYKSREIVLDSTTLRTLQLNGNAKRLNRTLLDKARALLFESSMQKNMWREAMLTPAYLQNRSPAKVVEKTTYQIWNGRRP